MLVRENKKGGRRKAVAWLTRACNLARRRRGAEVSTRYLERRTGFRRKTLGLLRKGGLPRRIGRPISVLDEETLDLLDDLLRSMGPDVGLPALRELLPGTSRAALERHLRGYRKAHRGRRSSILYSLSWTRPGSVWAADLSHPPRRLDGGARALLAVRDLASGYTVAWCALPRGSGEEVETAMRRLFRRHGAPLVLKTDNGSCFVSDVHRDLLDHFDVTPLRSPRAWPQYNGACEAGIGALRESTEIVAAQRDEVRTWTLESLEEARERMNGRPRSSKGRRTAAALWAGRPKLRRHRRAFQQELRLRAERAGLLPKGSARRRARRRRKAIEGALRRCGLLRIRRRVVRARCLRPGPTSYR